MSSRLLVLVPDWPSVILDKGEYPELYYNPGNLFEEVHLLLTNSDDPSVAEMQHTVGNARLHIHNLPKPDIRWTLGWQRPLVEGWVRNGLELARQIKPGLVRTHNNFMEGYLASRIKDDQGTPYVMSLHGVWDRDHLDTIKDWITKYAHYKFEKISLKNSDSVIAVYGSIIRYAEEYGAGNVHLIYNILAENIPRRENKALSAPPRLITINRQVPNKNPVNVIRAIRDIDCYYMLVGDGSEHKKLKAVAHEEGVEHKVEFVKAMPNEELIKLLPTFDILVSHCDYWGMSKTVIEASLAGLPTVINYHPFEPIPEYDGDWLLRCDNTADSYRDAIVSLIEDDELRNGYAQRAYDHARAAFDPELMEQKTVALYQDVMRAAGTLDEGEAVAQ